MSRKIDHHKNNAAVRGCRDHQKTDSQKEKEKKLGATDAWKKKVSSTARKHQAKKTSVVIDDDMKKWLKDRGHQ